MTHHTYFLRGGNPIVTPPARWVTPLLHHSLKLLQRIGNRGPGHAPPTSWETLTYRKYLRATAEHYNLFQNFVCLRYTGGMSRHALTDEQWAVIEPLIPARRRGPGRPRPDDRTTLNGILYVLQTGCAWEDLPRDYGAAVTCWRRLQQWSDDGTWERIWRALLSQLDAQRKLEWSRAFLDGSFVPAKKGALASARRRSAKARK
jgi:transposase